MLVSLEPIGIGTAQCESLSSYVQRLAAAHGCLPAQLVFRYLTWVDVGDPSRVGEWKRRPGRVRIGQNNNSFGHADVWLRLLQSENRRNDLIALTTRNWDQQIPHKGFQRTRLAWCPLCLSEDVIPYHRLYWSLQEARTCLAHRTLLLTKCPICTRLVPVLHERSAIAWCPVCKGSLLEAAPTAGDQLSAFDHWATDEIGRIVELGSTLCSTLEWKPANELRVLSRSARIHTPTEFAERVGVNKSTAWYWFEGRTHPTLGMLLHIYYLLGGRLSKVLFGIPDPEIDLRQPELNLRPVRTPLYRDWNIVKARLERELLKPLPEARSLAEIARELGIVKRQIRTHFPPICLEISGRHRSRRAAEVLKRHEALKDRILGAVLNLLQRGIFVNQETVADLLNEPGLFCRPTARTILRDILRTSLTVS